MTSKKYKEFMKKIMESSEVSEKQMEKNESALADRWEEIEDRNTDKLIKELEGMEK